MKTFQTIEAAANLKGMAKYTYNRVMSAMAEDTTAAMLHTFATLTDGAKAITLQSGKFSNLYIRGERKGMTADEAAKELTERAAAGVTRKLRKIDMVCAVAFLTEYISRQRKADEPTTEPTDNTPATMNANEIVASLNEKQVRTAAAKLLPAKFFDGYFTPERGNIALLRQILEDYVFEYDTTATEIIEAAGADETANETKAPEYSELSHAATNIVLAAENTQSIYAAHVEPLLRSLERKAAKGVTLSLDTLAKSYAMAVIIRESIKEVKRTSYDPFSANADGRRAAALYLANIYIGEL